MEFTVQNICGFLIRSKLMAPDEVRAMSQRWQEEARDKASSLSYFGKWLVARNYATEYQVNLLLKGHADDFFLNQYRILDRLGRGRMAGVYKAQHSLGQVVAIKVLPPSRAKNPQMLARFQREGQLALKLRHPNVVRSFQMGEANGIHFLVMEFLEGETLDEILARRKRLPYPEAVRIIHQALMGLQHIADQGMVHRDLKPSNLMLYPVPAKNEPDNTLSATVKILDIGLGRELFDEDAPEDRNTEITGEGVLLGTPDYLAPEQARDPRNIDIRADIYSLGCVLFHLLAGQPPFPDKNLLNQMVRHATEPPRPIKDFGAVIPDGLQQVLNWMMAKKADQRYPSPERAAQSLQVFLVAEAKTGPHPEEAERMKKYLTWLEGADGAKQAENTPARAKAAPPPSPPAPLPAPMPAAAPVPMAAPTSRAISEEATLQPGQISARQIPTSAKSPSTPVPPTRSRRRKRNPPAQLVPNSPDDADDAPEIDVELVPLNPPPSGFLARMNLSKREWIILGAAGGAILILLVVVLILLQG